MVNKVLRPETVCGTGGAAPPILNLRITFELLTSSYGHFSPETRHSVTQRKHKPVQVCITDDKASHYATGSSPSCILHATLPHKTIFRYMTVFIFLVI